MVCFRLEGMHFQLRTQLHAHQHDGADNICRHNDNRTSYKWHLGRPWNNIPHHYLRNLHGSDDTYPASEMLRAHHGQTRRSHMADDTGIFI